MVVLMDTQWTMIDIDGLRSMSNDAVYRFAAYRFAAKYRMLSAWRKR